MSLESIVGETEIERGSEEMRRGGRDWSAGDSEESRMERRRW